MTAESNARFDRDDATEKSLEEIIRLERKIEPFAGVFMRPIQSEAYFGINNDTHVSL